MNEIGGYFGLEQLVCNEYYRNLISLNSGRNALLYILKARKINKLYIPYFICDSVTDILEKTNFDFEYYNIDLDFMPIFNKNINNYEYMYIVNYYGQLTDSNIILLKQKYKNIIIDNAQAFFQRPIENIDTIYTCRKFFGVPDGAYLSTNKIIDENLDVDVSKEKVTHLLGRYEGTASEYYNDFKNNEESYANEPLKYMSKLTHNILGAIDYRKVYDLRNKNYAYLDGKLGRYNKLNISMPKGAFVYPFYMKNGIEIRKILTNQKIYIPTLWPNVLNNSQKNSIEYDYAANILPLPCDQRYDQEDMDYLINVLLRYLN